MLRSSYANIESKKSEEIISKIAHVQALLVSSSNALLGNVSFILLKYDKYGPRFISTVEETVKNNAERMKKGTMYNIKDLSIENFVGIEADVSRKLSFTSKPARGESLKNVIVRICRGNIIVEINDTNLHLTDRKIIEIAEKLFKQYREAKEHQEG